MFYVPLLMRVKSNCCNKGTSDLGMFKAIEMKRAASGTKLKVGTRGGILVGFLVLY